MSAARTRLRARPGASRLRSLLGVAILSLPALAQEAGRVEIDPAGIAGSLIIAGGGALPDEVFEAFLELAGGKEAAIVVVPTASGRADGEGAEERYLTSWWDRGVEDVVLLHTRSREEADRRDFCAPLREADGVWFGGGSQSRITDVYKGTMVEKELGALLRRGGVVGGSSAGAAIMTRLMITGGSQQASTGEGFGFLPGAVVDQHFLARNRQGRLIGLLEANPGLFGMGIDEGTAVVVRGRRLRVLGSSEVLMYLAPGAGRSLRTERFRAGGIVDLVSWQRAARARASSQFPPAEPETPEVANGTSIMVGGGRVGKEILDRFLEAAGGPEAPIVVVPTANGAAAGRLLRMLEEAGAQNLRVFHVAHPSEVPGAENLDFLREARGVWFGGGRQWRLVDAYEGTEAVRLFHRVLARGGVIAGSSAGCSIQAGYMVRGNPLGNRQISAEGYERGFGFVPGVAVDQHFSQRDRFDDMTELIRQYPQLLGFGVDESTAIAVRGHVLEVLGEGRVALYDYLDHAPEREGDRDHQMLEPGTRYDLKERRVLDRE